MIGTGNDREMKKWGTDVAKAAEDGASVVIPEKIKSSMTDEQVMIEEAASRALNEYNLKRKSNVTLEDLLEVDRSKKSKFISNQDTKEVVLVGKRKQV